MRRQLSKAALRPAHLSRRGHSTSSLNTRSMRFEPLEDRRLLSVNFTGAYLQDFNSLVTSGTNQAWANDTTLMGWSLYRQPAPGTAITTINTSDGNSNAGSLYSFGTGTNNERALGGIGSGGAYFGSPANGAVASWMTVALTNTTGKTIDALDLQYTGEQWRDGGNITPQTMTLEYGFGATFDAVTTWTAPGSGFNFSSLQNTATATALDGNAAANRATGRGGTLNSLEWTAGSTLWIRWTETNDAGNDHGLAIDDFYATSTILVNTTADENDGVGVGGISLREAIALANTIPGANSIAFAPSLFGTPQTISLGSQLPTITQALTITGPGVNLLTLNAGNGTDNTFGTADGWRIFNVDDSTASLITVTLSGLTLTGGDVTAGGAISNAENLTILDSWIVANSGNFGGGVVSSGTLSVVGSTISGNKASSGGGGINSSGTATIVNSTISGNDATGTSGGGIINYAPPALTASLMLENSTITNNTAGAGSAVYSFGVGPIVATLNNSIINGTVLNTGSLNGSYNLFSGTNPGIIGSNNLFSANALLGPLAENGGPTKTHALLPGSPAIDAGRSPVAYYRFEEATGTAAPDLIGAHPGVLENGIILNQSGPVQIGGNAASFDGVNDYVSVATPFSASQLSGESYSVELWFNTNNSTTEQSLFALTDNAGGHAVLLELRPDGVLRFLNRIPAGNSGGESLTSPAATFVAGQWNHLAAVRDGSSMRIYLNGVMVSSLSGATGSLPADLRLTMGRLSQLDPSRPFGGTLDEVVLHNRALTPSEVALHASASLVDQRGVGFSRVVDANRDGTARTDIGAFEADLPLVVDTNTDVVDGNYAIGQLSLREAIQIANSRPGKDTITFASTMNGQTILLGGSEIAITEALTIDGPGANLITVDAGNGTDDVFNTGDGHRIFSINDGIAGTFFEVDISGLRLTGGDIAGSGGAILSNESLTLNDSILAGNAATGSGGAILSGNDAILNISRTTIADNRTGDDGGGIATFGTADIANSTISGNIAIDNGGGVHSYYYDQTTIRSSTISGNTAHRGGGVFNRSGTVNISESTITLNHASFFGGGIARINSNGAMNVTSSIVAGNSAGSFDNVGLGLNTDTFNVLSGDPLLGPLADNGGPTKTHALLFGSPAIDAGDPAIVPSGSEFDQRGGPFRRVMGTKIDIGAVEQVLGVPSTTRGGILAIGQSNFFSFSATAGTLYSIFTTAGTLTDTELWLYDTDGVTQLAYDDESGAGSASRILWTAPASGTYFLEVRDWQNNATGTYTLDISEHVDDHSNTAVTATPIAIDSTIDGWIESNADADFFSFTVTAGKVYRLYTTAGSLTDTTLRLYSTNGTTSVGFDDNSGVGNASQLSVAFNTSGTFFLEVRDNGDNNTGSYTISVEEYPDDHSHFPVNATPIGAPSTSGGEINFLADRDFFSFSGLQDVLYRIFTTTGTLTDTELWLYDTNGVTELAYNDESGVGSASQIIWSPPTDGTYFLAVRAYQNSSVGTYTLDIVPISLTVTNTNDSGLGSLRQAIIDANAVPGADTITFDNNLSGQTINLDSQLPTITDSLTITGLGANQLTLDAGDGTDTTFGTADGWGIFDIDDGTAAQIAVSISGLTLTGGDVTAGGAIRNAEDLTVLETWIVANSGSFGGGIVNSGTLTVERSTISGNKASSGGGGINSSGTTTIRNSTISENDAAFASGGGIINYSPPSGVTTLIVENSTITSNTANVGTALQSFGGGSHSATFSNSIVDGTVLNTGTLTGSYNLFSGADPGITGTNNLFNTNAMLGPLADNGGPTQTHALLPGSLALDSGLTGTIIDNFSANDFATNYNFVNVYNFPTNAPSVSSGTVNLNVGNGAAAHIWNQGNKLQNVGDLVSVDLGFNYPLDNPNGNVNGSAGLALFSEVNGGTLLSEVRINTDLVDGSTIFNLEDDAPGVGTTPIVGTPSGLMHLQIRVTGTTPTTITIESTLSGPGITTVVKTKTLNTTTAYFGLAAFNVVGNDSIHDNLAFYSADSAVDQRGRSRVANGGNGFRQDIGAYESQADSSADFDGDGDVDGRDFLAWQRGYGKPNAVRSDGNSDDDLDVDASDLSAWQVSYGEQPVPVVAEDNEISDLGFMISDEELSRPVQASRALLLNTGGALTAFNSRTALPLVPVHATAVQVSSGAQVSQDLYVEEVDRAFDELSLSTVSLGNQLMAPFGQMVARRKLNRLPR